MIDGDIVVKSVALIVIVYMVELRLIIRNGCVMCSGEYICRHYKPRRYCEECGPL